MKNPDKLINISFFTNLNVGLIRWRHTIRNLTIRNRDPRFPNFLIFFLDFFQGPVELYTVFKVFPPPVKNLVKNMSKNLRNVQTLATKNTISYHTSTPYLRMLAPKFGKLGNWKNRTKTLETSKNWTIRNQKVSRCFASAASQN